MTLNANQVVDALYVDPHVPKFGSKKCLQKRIVLKRQQACLKHAESLAHVSACLKHARAGCKKMLIYDSKCKPGGRCFIC